MESIGRTDGGCCPCLCNEAVLQVWFARLFGWGSRFWQPRESFLVPTGFAIYLAIPICRRFAAPPGLKAQHALFLGNSGRFDWPDYQGMEAVSLWNRSSELFNSFNRLSVRADVVVVPIAGAFQTCRVNLSEAAGRRAASAVRFALNMVNAVQRHVVQTAYLPIYWQPEKIMNTFTQPTPVLSLCPDCVKDVGISCPKGPKLSHCRYIWRTGTSDTESHYGCAGPPHCTSWKISADLFHCSELSGVVRTG